ncbi:MAG: hypothetical protein R6W90_15250 [Ignavibacteriaceae bacterium]
MKKKDNLFVFKATKQMCKKVKPVIKEGDICVVDLKGKPKLNQYVLVSENDKQWIETYTKKREGNYYPVVKVIMPGEEEE